MLGHSLLAASTSMDSRIFIYEIEGIHQTDQVKPTIAAIRSSSTTRIPVPFDRMSDFMQRMHRLGGRIVAIHPSGDEAGEES